MKKKISTFSFAAMVVMLISLIGAMSLTVGAEDSNFIPSDSPPNVTNFTDEFDGDELSDKWTLCYTPTTAASETIGVANGKFTAAATNWNTFKTLTLYTGEETWSDYAVEASLSVAAQDPRNIGIFVRGTDVSDGRYGFNGYYIALNTDKRSYGPADDNGKYNDYPLIVDLYSYNGTTGIPLASFEVADKHFAKNINYNLKVLVCGNTIRIYLDGAFVGQHRDSTYKAGYTGIKQYMAAFSLDTFTVRALTAKEIKEFEDSSGSGNKYNVLFNADFNGDALPEGMTLCYTPTAEDSETVGVADGKFTAKASGWNTFKKLKLYAGKATWKNYVAEASFCVSAQDPRHMGVFVRGANVADNGGTFSGYYVAINTDKRSYVTGGVNEKYNDHPLKIDVYNSTNGTDTLIKSFEVDGKHFAKNTYYKLKVIVYENALRIYFDNKFVGQLTDKTYISGYAGINQYMAAFSLDYFTVRELTEEEIIECGYEIPVTNFTDKFDGDELSDKWTLCYTPTIAASETIGVANGKFTAAATNWNTFKDLTLYTGNERWSNYAVEASLSVMAQDPRNIGIFVRGTDVSAGRYGFKGYYIAVNTDKRSYAIGADQGKYAELPLQIDVYSYDGTAGTLIDTFKVSDKHFAKGATFELKVLIYGDVMRIYFDDTFVGQVTDSTYTNGYVGINQYMAAFSLDTFTQRALTDDELLELGVIPEKEEDKENGFFTGIIMMLLRKKAGESTPIEITPIDGVYESFDGDTLSDKWTVCYEPTVVDEAVVDSYALKDGQLVASATHWNSLKKMRLYTGNADWTDYAVETTFTPNGTDPRSIGVFVRASNIGTERYAYNGYYVHINTDKRSGTALNIQIEKSDGKAGEIVLSQNVGSRTFAKGKTYKLTVLVYGDTMRVYVDGEFVCTYKDDTYKNGFVGINTYMATFKADDFTVRTLTNKEAREFVSKVKENSDIPVEADLSKATVVDLSSESSAKKLLTVVEFTEDGINGLSEFDEAEGALSLKYSESAGARAEYGSRIKFQLKFNNTGALAEGKSYMVVTYKTDMQSGTFRMNNLRSVKSSLVVAANIGVSAGEYVKTAPININATTDDGSNSLNNYYERLNKHKNGVLFFVENGEQNKSFFIKEIAFFASEAEAAAYSASK